jgi:multidrug efflux pump subunit AcrB
MNHPIMAIVILWLITIIGLVCILELPVTPF